MATPVTRLMSHAERGLTMVELLVYSLLLSGVLIIIGSLLISSLRTEDTVSGVIDATTSAQLIATSVETGVRNSTTFRLTTVGTSDQVLIARVVDNDGVASCRAWYYSDSTDSIRYRDKTGVFTAPNWTTASLESWTLLASGVQPASGAAASAPIFSEAGAKITLNFRVLAGDDPPATVNSSAARRITQGSTQCFT